MEKKKTRVRKPKVRIGPISGRELKTAEQLLSENPLTGRLKREIENIETEYVKERKKIEKKWKKKKGIEKWIE